MNYKITASIFIILFSSIFLLNIFKKPIVFSKIENRYLKEFPIFNSKDFFLGEFNKDIEEYYSDQFIFRDNWITIKSFSEYIIGKKNIDNIFIGKDDYIFERHLPKDIETNNLEKNLDSIKLFLKNINLLNISTSFIIVPSSSHVLSEYMPRLAYKYNENNIIDYLDLIISRYDNINFIPILEDLKNNSDKYIYYKTDHHWTTKGAYIAYKAWAKENNINPLLESDFIIKTVSDNFFGTTHANINLPFIKPDKINLYYIKKDMNYNIIYNQNDSTKTSNLYNKEFLDKKDKYSIFLNGNNGIININTNNKNNKNLIIIKDSFANSFSPFIINHFENIHIIDLRFFNSSIMDYIKKNKITDILFLYSIYNISTDKDIFKISR
ncbi:MAG: hypothetical protein KFW09_02985 [Oscillospiraceae bacterium]|nr:hypothetical protein [Oscillospiraceae bacterium]